MGSAPFPMHDGMRNIQPNRLGAVYEMCYFYLISRLKRRPQQDDIFSIILFNDYGVTVADRRRILEKDIIYEIAHKHSPEGGTNFNYALIEAQKVLRSTPINIKPRMIFLTDGESKVTNSEIFKSFWSTFGTPRVMESMQDFQFIMFGLSTHGKQALKQAVQLARISFPVHVPKDERREKAKLFYAKDYPALKDVFLNKIVQK